MNLVEHLVAARELIARGWTQKVFSRDAEGRITPVGGPAAASWCMSGALRQTSTNVDEDLRATRALMAVIGWPIAPWNDQPERTQQQVLAAFDAAIAIAREEGVDKVGGIR